MQRARDQLLTFVAFPGRVAVTNNPASATCEPAVVQRKVTNGYRAMWAAKGEADVRTVVATAALRTKATSFATLLATINRLITPPPTTEGEWNTRVPKNTPWVITCAA